MKGGTFKYLALMWLVGIALYIGLVLFPVRFPLVDLPVAGGVAVGDLLHFLAFVILAGSFPIAFSSRLLALFSPVALILLNVVLEFAQMHIPNRRFSEMDVLAGTVGCLVGALIGWIVRIAGNKKAPSERV